MTDEATDEVVEDPFGKEFQEALRANDAVLQGLKYDIGQQMLLAQEGDGDYPSPFEVAAIKKLESQIHNDRMFLEARAMTRRGTS